MYEKKIAQTLRKRGLTYSEIVNTLGRKIPKSTLSYWCRGVQIEESHANRIRQISRKNLIKARKKALEVNKQKRKLYLKKLEDRNIGVVKDLTKNDYKIALAMLYLGEGSKWKSHRGLSLGSADTVIIKTYIKLLKICYDIEPESLRARVQYRADQKIDELQDFWSLSTGIPLNHFYQTTPDKRTFGKVTKNLDYKGVCVVSGGSTEVQLELQIIADNFFRAVSSVG